MPDVSESENDMPVSKRMTKNKLLIAFLAVLLLLGLEWLARTGAANAAPNDSPARLTNANCTMCHQDEQLNGFTRDSIRVNLTVDTQGYNESVHGQAGVLCVGCHSTFTTYPHSEVEQVTCEQCHVDNATIVVPLPHDNGRAMEAHFNETCKNCHADVYSANSIHAAVAASGQVNAPLCSDCHGAHEIQSPAVPPERIITTCSRCHTGVYENFLSNEHFGADPLAQTCADCHIPHELQAAPAEVTPTPQPTPVEESGGQTYLSLWNSTCTMCHNYPNFTGKAEDSSTVSLTIVEEELSKSVHGKAGLGCAACHSTITGYPHHDTEQVSCSTCHAATDPEAMIIADLPYESTRALSIELNEACYSCHEEEFDASANSMHTKSFEEGNLQAPLCVDCHGSHAVQPVQGSRASISQSCAKCHTAVYTSYQSSVHGEAIEKDGSLEAPTCADCHGMHNVIGPSETGFRNATVAICTRCHADQEMMSRYGVASDLFTPDMDSFHGLPLSLFNQQGLDQTVSNPVCYDCHGVHTIRKSDDPLSTVYPANLVGTCQKCHPDASSRFASADLAHTRSSAPGLSLKSGIELIYASLIFILFALLVIYILLDVRKRRVEKKQLSQPVTGD